jgi:indoleacetamide hydrolase
MPRHTALCEDFVNDTTAISRHIASREITNLSMGLAAAAAAVRNGDITSEAYTAALLQR